MKGGQGKETKRIKGEKILVIQITNQSPSGKPNKEDQKFRIIFDDLLFKKA